MKSYEDTKDANERAPSPELSPEYPEEVSFGPKLKFYLCPLTRLTLKKGPTQKNLFQFSV